MALTRAEYNAQVKRADDAEAAVKAAQAETAAVRVELQQSSAALQNSEQLRKSLADQVKQLRAEIADAPRAAADAAPAPSGPRADEPRYMYRADEARTARVVASLADAVALQKSEKGLWFDHPEKANVRYLELLNEPVVDD